MSQQLIYPMAFYVAVMFITGHHLFFSRVHGVRSGSVDHKFFKSRVVGAQSVRLSVLDRHYDNQFQNPILFFVTCLAHLQVSKANMLTLLLAWGFVLSRLVHSWIFLGENHILKRAGAFISGWYLIFAMWAQLVYFVAT